MSKVVRVVKRVVQGAARLVKKVVTSPIGKMFLLAGAAFFVGPAVMGLAGAGGAAAAGGLSGISGAMANVSAAWSGLGTAASSAMAGNLGTAASQLGTAASGGIINGGIEAANAAAALGGAAAPTAGTAAATQLAGSAPQLAGQVANAGVKAGLSAAVPPVTAAPPLPLAPTAPPTPGFSLAEYLKSPGGGGLMLAGGQVLAGVGQGYMAQAAQNNQEELNAQARARYNSNNGTKLWKGV
jgi:hypothetical protein